MIFGIIRECSFEIFDKCFSITFPNPLDKDRFCATPRPTKNWNVLQRLFSNDFWTLRMKKKQMTRSLNFDKFLTFKMPSRWQAIQAINQSISYLWFMLNWINSQRSCWIVLISSIHLHNEHMFTFHNLKIFWTDIKYTITIGPPLTQESQFYCIESFSLTLLIFEIKIDYLRHQSPTAK